MTEENNSPVNEAQEPAGDSLPVADSPLGLDPVEQAIPQEPVQETPQPEPQPEPTQDDNQTKLTQEQYDELLRKANGFDTLTTDPVLAPQIADHLRAKTGRVGQREHNPEVPTNSISEEQYRQLVASNAHMQAQMFMMQNPDAAQHEAKMADLIRKYNMSLPEAYELAKGAVPPNSQSVEKSVAPAPQPTSESNNGATDIQDSPKTSMSEAEKRIMDRKALPRIDDAFREAWKLANQISKE